MKKKKKNKLKHKNMKHKNMKHQMKIYKENHHHKQNCHL